MRPSRDEGDAARRLAQRLGTSHHEVQLRTGEITSHLGAAISSLDQPSADGVNTYFISQAARQAGLTVALSGIGGDELFAGYSAFRVFRRLERLAGVLGRVPLAARRASMRADSVARLPTRVRKGLALLSSGAHAESMYASLRTMFSPGQRVRLLHSAALDPPNGSRVDAKLRDGTLDAVNAYGVLELTHYVRNTLLRDTDSMSMAHGLEVREPLLDHELIEMAMSIPGHLKLAGEGNKSVLTAAVPEVDWRTRMAPKMGFTLPFERWMRTTARDFVEERLLGPQLSFLDQNEVRRLWRAFVGGRSREISWSRMWTLTVLADYTSRHGLTP